MKKLFQRRLKKLWRSHVSRQTSQKLIEFISDWAGLNLLIIAYRQMGIQKYENSYQSGEEYLIKQVLGQYLKSSEPVFFDVGANQGFYSLELRASFPNAQIFAFEPNPHTFKILESKLNHSKDQCYCLGLGCISKKEIIYTYSNSLVSQHASLYKAALSELRHASELTSMEVQITTVDDFCLKYQINHIDFLKIDTEGNEMDVLQGAARMLAENNVSIIQFEFNEFL